MKQGLVAAFTIAAISLCTSSVAAQPDLGVTLRVSWDPSAASSAGPPMASSDACRGMRSFLDDVICVDDNGPHTILVGKFGPGGGPCPPDKYCIQPDFRQRYGDPLVLQPKYSPCQTTAAKCKRPGVGDDQPLHALRVGPDGCAAGDLCLPTDFPVMPKSAYLDKQLKSTRLQARTSGGPGVAALEALIRLYELCKIASCRTEIP